MTQSKRIAVTGGIGSGKSAVMEILAEMGYPVFSCDEISHALWQDEDYLSTLSAAFPACSPAGRIDKQKLSALVFSDEAARKRLEKIAHPRIMQELLREMTAPACFAEVPLLFEGGFASLFDGVLLVERERGSRIGAVMQRDGLTQEETERRISAQLSDPEREKEGVVILKNDGTVEELKEKVKNSLRSFGL